MAKIEEVTALLIDEIAAFEKAVTQLKEESTIIQQQKITVDTTNVKTVFKDFEQKLNSNYQIENEQLKVIQNKLNKTVIIPNWMTILFSLFFIGLLISVGLNFYQFQKSEKINMKRNELKNHMQQFFKENDNSLKQYKKWKSNK
ncbi:conserved protein of unknown function [Tenacibaculum soleae]|uniref:DUF6730 family protein n=1 Tax=Tenacibaculum soleae TaxID=447689 RepID=UPI003AB46737